MIYQGVQKLTYLGERSRVDDNFEHLGHLLEEMLGTRSLLNIDITDATIDIDSDCVISVTDRVELAVYECLI